MGIPEDRFKTSPHRKVFVKLAVAIFMLLEKRLLGPRAAGFLEVPEDFFSHSCVLNMSYLAVQDTYDWVTALLISQLYPD